MNRSIYVATAMVMTLLTACSTSQETVSTEDLFAEPFTCTANITTDDLSATGTLIRYAPDSWDIEFSEPSTLSGVKLTFNGTTSEASYKGLTYSMPKTAVPVNSMLLCLASAVDSVAGSEELDCTASDGLLTVKGSVDGGDYILTLEEDSGNLAMFEMKNLGLIITFVDVETLDVATETETATENSAPETETETETTT